MRTLRLNSTGSEVTTLQEALTRKGYTVNATGSFDQATDTAVRQFQHDNHLGADGIVGNNTWQCLLDGTPPQPATTFRLTEADYQRAAQSLNVPVAAVKAVKDVETGGRGGFLAEGKPTILFEGHIFWSQLKKVGINPDTHVAGNEDILYPRWTKGHYKGGMAEYTRLEKAKRIHEVAALCSASWGLFQIMGFNHAACGCRDVREFVARMCETEGTQLDLFVVFLRHNGWDKYLRNLDWAGFARHYNGPSYAQNKYDDKLRRAYQKYSH